MPDEFADSAKIEALKAIATAIKAVAADGRHKDAWPLAFATIRSTNNVRFAISHDRTMATLTWRDGDELAELVLRRAPKAADAPPPPEPPALTMTEKARRRAGTTEG
jgi:hypothetical protein